MRRFTLLFALLCAICASALEIPKGTFYFDNSLTQYESVKLVYGNDYQSVTYVKSMTLDEGDRWKITFDEAVPDMTRYMFAYTSLEEGTIDRCVTTVKGEITDNGGYRTATIADRSIVVGGIFVPSSNEQWAQGSWQALNADGLGYSGTLPVMFINTDGGVAITSKENYVDATYYLDNMGIDGIESFGSKDEPLPLKIRGRGNYTWTGFDKKPYRLKLDSKAKLMGMKKSKHFVLMAGADDNLAFLRNIVGYELSRRMGMPWTPSAEPVEVVLNGDYIGLYFLTENIRVDEDRVNIVEQADNATDPYEITGGWLVEIDNYDTDPHITIREGNGKTIWFTYKTPEELSADQEAYLYAETEAMDDAIYTTDKSSTAWESLIDIDRLARFYVIQEIMDNTESFHGSCYLHKEIGYDTKWMFGPVWDFGCTYYSSYQKFIYIEPPYGQTWIEEIAKFPRFQEKVKEVWQSFKGNNYEGLDEFISEFIDQIASAAVCNYNRWPQYENSNVNDGKNSFNSKLTQRIAWLVEQWGEGVAEIDNTITASNDINIASSAGAVSVSASNAIDRVAVYDLAGKLVASVAPGAENCSVECTAGLYVVEVTVSDVTERAKVIVK